jgi:hypothetical protein
MRNEETYVLREQLGVVPINMMLGAHPADTFALKRTYSQARATMHDLGIVERIEEAWFGGGVGEVVAVFLFRFVDLDGNNLYGWLVCGDVPWFFTLVADGDFSKAILERYVNLAYQWNVDGGTEPEGCFFGPYHSELTDDLTRRLLFIEREVVRLMPLPTLTQPSSSS